MALDTRTLTDERCFDLPEWRGLLALDPHRHVFATPEWHRVWWDEFGSERDLFVLTLERDGEVMGIAPLCRQMEQGRRVLRFIGGVELTDYLGPICAPEDRNEVAATLVHWLETTEVEWDEFDAHNLPVPFGFADVLADHVDRGSLGFAVDQQETSAILLLPDDWDAYLMMLRSKERHELKRKQRRLAREHPDSTIRAFSMDSLDKDLRLFVEMHRGTEGHKGHFMKPEIATFFERVAHAFAPLGWLRLDFLEVEGRPVASSFGFELDKTVYLYNSAYEPDASRISPGLMLVSSLLEDCIARGLERFDFLRGPERYKYQLGAGAVPLHNLRVFNERAL